MDALFYDHRINRFLDCAGNILHDLHSIFDTWQLDAWRKRGEYGEYMQAKDGNLWEVFYYIDEEDF